MFYQKIVRKSCFNKNIWIFGKRCKWNKTDQKIRTDGIKKDDIEIDVNYGCIGNEYKDLIDNIFKFRLKDGHLRFTEFDDRKPDLTNIGNNYLEKKVVHVDNKLFNFEKSIKNLPDVNNRIHRIIND